MGRIIEAVPWKFLPSVALAFVVAVWAGTSWSDAIATRATSSRKANDPIRTDSALRSASELIEEGRYTFRYETFGNEAFWGQQLGLHRTLAGDSQGGEGPGVTLETALAMGLKLDSEALPTALAQSLRSGKLDLQSAKAFQQMLELDAVVGLTGFFDVNRKLTSIGVQCALCHSTVDDRVTAGVGHRLDGWANRDLNLGALLALAPNLTPLETQLGLDDGRVRRVLRAWGPGKLDVPLILDRLPVKRSVATLIPPAFGRAGLINQSRHGQGVFYDPRASDAVKVAMAADAGFTRERLAPDLVTPRLAALQVYQLVLRAPRPLLSEPPNPALERGKALFEGRARCASCHVPPLFTEPDRSFHEAAEVGIDDPELRVRTAPLAGLFTHLKGGLYRDGRFPSVEAVVVHYDRHFKLGLTAQERDDLVTYLKSL